MDYSNSNQDVAQGASKFASYCGSMPYFHFGYNEIILFGEWTIDSVGGLIWSMIVIGVMSVAYEGLKYYREYVSKANAQKKSDSCCEGSTPPAPSMWNRLHLYQTFLHGVQFLVSYFVMLIFMTYNVWLCLAITLGTVLGYFLFGWKKAAAVDVTEHCH